MNFRDYDINKLNLNNIDDFSKLILYYLCGTPYNDKEFNKSILNLLKKIIEVLESGTLYYEQFNEILLLFNQDRISRDFFNYFFSEGKLNLEILKDGIVEFRGLSILHFGNFKFTFKRFSKMKKKEIDNHFRKLDFSTDSLEATYKNRPNPIIDIKKVNKENTWYLGYISSTLISKESKHLKEILESCDEPEDNDAGWTLSVLNSTFEDSPL